MARNLSISGNVNDGTFADDILIEAANFTALTLNDSNLVNNENGIALLEGTVSGAVSIGNCFISDNVGLDFVVDVEGVTALSVSDVEMASNEAADGVFFGGMGSGDAVLHSVYLMDNDFQSDTVDAMDSQTAFSLDNFVDAEIAQFEARRNRGDHLFELLVSGNISWSDCILRRNEMTKTMLQIQSEGGSLQMESVRIEDNDADRNGSTSMQCLLCVNQTASVSLRTVTVADNSAAAYLSFSGDSSGDFVAAHLQIEGNVNDGTFAEDVLVEADGFRNLILNQSTFSFNEFGSIFVRGALDGDVSMIDVVFANNTQLSTLMVIDGINGLSVTNSRILGNALSANGVLLTGSSNGDAVVQDLVFSANGVDGDDVIADSLLLLDSFSNVDVSECSMSGNRGRYLLRSTVTDDASFSELVLNDNQLVDCVVDIASSNDGNLEMTSIEIERTEHALDDGALSIASLVSADGIAAATVSGAQIHDNSVQRLIELGGVGMGDFSVLHSEMTGNANLDPLTRSVLIEATDFMDSTLRNCSINDNDNGVGLLHVVMDGDLLIEDATMSDNDGFNSSLIRMDGVGSLSMSGVITNS